MHFQVKGFSPFANNCGDGGIWLSPQANFQDGIACYKWTIEWIFVLFVVRLVVAHPSSVMFLHWTLPSICHWTYFHTSKCHVTWIIKKVNRIPSHCDVIYESVHSLARGHVIRVWWLHCNGKIHWVSIHVKKIVYASPAHGDCRMNFGSILWGWGLHCNGKVLWAKKVYDIIMWSLSKSKALVEVTLDITIGDKLI